MNANMNDMFDDHLWGPRGHGRHGSNGPLGQMMGGFGAMSSWANPMRRGRGRGRRGDVRAAILALLADKPMNGYQLMGAIADKSKGLWSPGAGSIYPALEMLTDEGLIAPQEGEEGKKVYQITDAGRLYIQEHPEQASEPWERVTSGLAGYIELQPALGKLAAAVQQIAVAGTPSQHAQAEKVLEQARKDIYKLLARDEESE